MSQLPEQHIEPLPQPAPVPIPQQLNMMIPVNTPQLIPGQQNIMPPGYIAPNQDQAQDTSKIIIFIIIFNFYY